MNFSFELDGLERLYLCNVGLPKIPETVSTLENLLRFDASWNPEISSIPREVGEVRYLERLNLEGCSVTAVNEEVGGIHSQNQNTLLTNK